MRSCSISPIGKVNSRPNNMGGRPSFIMSSHVFLLHCPVDREFSILLHRKRTSHALEILTMKVDLGKGKSGVFTRLRQPTSRGAKQQSDVTFSSNFKVIAVQRVIQTSLRLVKKRIVNSGQWEKGTRRPCASSCLHSRHITVQLVIPNIPVFNTMHIRLHTNRAITILSSLHEYLILLHLPFRSGKRGPCHYTRKRRKPGRVLLNDIHSPYRFDTLGLVDYRAGLLAWKD